MNYQDYDETAFMADLMEHELEEHHVWDKNEGYFESRFKNYEKENTLCNSTKI